MPLPRRITGFNARYLNRMMLRLVGHFSLVDLEHVGRRTGVVRHTPLMAFRHGDEVTIALSYGPQVQWLKNVTTAGGARMWIGGQWVRLGPPTRLGTAEGLTRMPQPQRTLLAWPIRCADFVTFAVLGPGDEGPQAA